MNIIEYDCVFDSFIQNNRNPLSVFGATMRTTSSLESLNSVLRRSFPLHPRLFKFIDCLQWFEFSKSLDVLELFASNIPKDQRKGKRQRDQKREQKIQFCVQKLGSVDAEFDVGWFLDTMASEDFLQDYGKIIFKYF